MVERIYNIPLRRSWLMAPKWRRSKKAVSAIKIFLTKHTKVKTIKLSRWVNEAVWEKGGKNPPGKISLKVTIDKDKSIANADLVELPKKATRKADAAKKQAVKAEKVAAKKVVEETPADEHKHDEEKEAKPSAPTQKQEMTLHK